MEFANFDVGTFESGHPFQGQEFYGIQSFQDKTNKLTTTNTVILRTTGMRIPKGDVNDPKSIGGCITRYLGKWSPGQTRLYCKPATASQKIHWTSIGYPKAAFSANQPIGVNTIRKMMKDAAVKLGFSATGHAFRRLFVTTIVNTPGVSTEEALASSRHNSVAAQRAYMVRGKASEAAKLAGMGFNAGGGN